MCPPLPGPVGSVATDVDVIGPVGSVGSVATDVEVIGAVDASVVSVVELGP